MKKIYLPIELSHEDMNKVVNKASEIGLPLDQILSHIAQGECAKLKNNNGIHHAKPTIKGQGADARLLAH